MAGFCKDFVQGAALKATLKRHIGRTAAKRNTSVLFGRLQPGKAVTKSPKAFRLADVRGRLHKIRLEQIMNTNNAKLAAGSSRRPLAWRYFSGLRRRTSVFIGTSLRRCCAMTSPVTQ
jgi:hypothetical protein